MANHTVRNHSRAARRHRRLLARLPADGAVADTADDAVDRVDDQLAMRDVLACMGRLSSRDQDIIALCAWAELSTTEAAAVLGVPEGTVRSRLSRARARMRSCLDEHAGQRQPGRAVEGRRLGDGRAR